MKDVPGTKYIIRTPEGNYRIAKKINGETVQFGVYQKLETAIHYRDYFQNKGWSNCLHERTRYTDTKRDSVMKYIRKSGNNYRIDKDINNKKYNFGTYDTLDEAIFFRDYFQENYWPLDERLKYTNQPSYISGNQERGWEVRKIINGECIHFGKFHDYDEALKEVELCKKYDWDFDSICDAHDSTTNNEVSFLEGKKAKNSFFKQHVGGRNDGFLFHRSILK